ncbi:uncharacterized protein PV07_03782 [Cladophialophora immunda]|uniref:Uncharacterized protein n=1 Tax=Cladophialophora immunda TaxID=569365 RepID=A0A0D2B3N7_9EURO|nr:uncharacterized protein PV07_03782 [Cladophialophora immunda]KIW32222.1 hypothetical protein PV07_03782 [Cladophialophora immunda]
MRFSRAFLIPKLIKRNSGGAESKDTDTSGITPSIYATPADCHTGNCKFPVYTSLPVDYHCSNITDQLRLSPGSSHTDGTYTLQVPYGPDLQSGYTADSFMELQMGSVNLYDEGSQGPYPNRLLLADVFLVLQNNGNKDDAFNMQYQALCCTLPYGIQLYTFVVRAGTLVETLGDFIAGNWTSQTADVGTEAYSASYWQLEADVQGAKRRVAIDALSQQDMASTFTAYFTNESSYGSAAGQFSQASLTKYFRTSSGATAIGSTYGPEQYIHIRWPYLLIPAVMVLLNLVFVSATCLQSRQQELSNWKSSALVSMLSQTTAEDEAAIIAKDCVLIGPSGRFNRICELEEWASERVGRVRSKLS